MRRGTNRPRDPTAGRTGAAAIPIPRITRVDACADASYFAVATSAPAMTAPTNAHHTGSGSRRTRAIAMAAPVQVNATTAVTMRTDRPS